MSKLSIVIGTYNRFELLKECIDSLINKIKTVHEIIITDAGSDDGTLEYLRELALNKEYHLILIEEGEKLGQAKSLNNVFKTLNSEYTVWLSDDNVAVYGMIDVAVTILDKHDSIGMVGLKVRDIAGEFEDSEYIGGIADTGVLNVNQGMIRTNLLHKLNYFDEYFKDYGIDIDLTTKVLLAGHKVVYTKSAAINHNRIHEQFPGAIDKETRIKNQKRTKELYNNKYSQLLAQSNFYIFKQKFYNLILVYFFYLFYSFFGYTERDWRNVCNSKYISFFDNFKSMGRAYYLIQSIKKRK